MAEFDPMKIDGTDEQRPKLDDPYQKKKPLKRKRLDPSLYTGSPEEKEAKINTFRNEINSLVKFCKDFASENRRAMLENVEKVGYSSASLNCVIACLMEESDLPLSKLVDDIFEKVKGRIGNGENVTRASVKGTVLMTGQRLFYGVTGADADPLEDVSEFALWCWETRDLKLMPKLLRAPVKVHRSCRKKIHERIEAVSAMISALEKSDDHPNSLKDLKKASEKLGKVLNEGDIRLLMENMAQKTSAEMAKKEEKLLIKQMEKNKRELEKQRKKMDREIQKEMMQSEKEQRRLYDEAQKEERRLEKEEHEMQKQLRRQQEEAEKDKKRKAKEEAELKKQLALKKQASLLEQFLKKDKTSSEHDSSLKKATSSYQPSIMTERKSETITIDMDSVLSQNVGMEAEAIWKSHIASWHSIGRLIRSEKKVHWGIRQKPKSELVKELKLTTNNDMIFEDETVEEKHVEGLIGSDIEGRLSETTTDRSLSNYQKRLRRMQLLQFDKSNRPAFYGVWSKKSQVVKPCCPFAKDPEVDYEIDSDEEWEEEEPGESLSDCDKDDADECMEECSKFDDEDENEDGFFVPDGYLSENEGVDTDEMESDELVQEVKNLPDSEKQVESEEFRTLLKRQKYLNNLTEHALKKNQPLIILNLMHEKTRSLPAEELTGAEKLEKMCLQALCICPFPDCANTEISIHDDQANDDLDALLKNETLTPPVTVAAIPDSDLPQIVSIIHSCPHGIGKIVESLQSVFPALSKTQLRNKVREISEFFENRWQVKKEILTNLGISKSPENNHMKTKSIASFFTKRCLPPSGKTAMNIGETSPHCP